MEPTQTQTQAKAPVINDNLQLKRKEIQCDSCAHLRTGPGRCDAYPRGIPRDILSGKVDHSTSFFGDRGITYEPLPENEKKSPKKQ